MPEPVAPAAAGTRIPAISPSPAASKLRRRKLELKYLEYLEYNLVQT